MLFVIYGSYNKSEAKKLEKILKLLYGPVEVKLLSTKPSASSVDSKSNDGGKLFSIAGSGSSDFTYDGKVMNVRFSDQPHQTIYNIITFVDMGVAETVVAKAVALAK